MLKIGYMVPEFPGQTHTFFWREINEIESLGDIVKIVSTRMPVNRLRAHEWSKVAERRTYYLHPLGLGIAADVFWIRASGLLRCFWLIASVRDASLTERLALPL